jgi:hypothetical protein
MHGRSGRPPVPDLRFSIEGARPVTYSVTPLLNLKLRITNREPTEEIQNVLLQCQIQIETIRRQYSPDEKSKLFELYGEPERWGQTLKTMLWTHASLTVPPFAGGTLADLPVPCTFDFNVATTKYFDALRDGEIPLCVLFSGTVFYRDSTGSLQIEQISWENEATYRLPVSVWKEMMAHYYPNSVWMSIRKDVFDRLYFYKIRRSIPSWEQAFESLLPADGSSALTNENGDPGPAEY